MTVSSASASLAHSTLGCAPSAAQAQRMVRTTYAATDRHVSVAAAAGTWASSLRPASQGGTKTRAVSVKPPENSGSRYGSPAREPLVLNNRTACKGAHVKWLPAPEDDEPLHAREVSPNRIGAASRLHAVYAEAHTAAKELSHADMRLLARLLEVPEDIEAVRRVALDVPRVVSAVALQAFDLIDTQHEGVLSCGAVAEALRSMADVIYLMRLPGWLGCLAPRPEERGQPEG